MRAKHVFRIAGLLVAAAVGPLVFTGCSDETKETGSVVEVNQQEQEQMQNAMRNFMKNQQAKKKAR
jgi:outer membrane murein-binding lipoprotein Lpp